MDLDCQDGVCAVPPQAPEIAGEAGFADAVLHQPGPVLVDFAAPWCGPCHMLALVLPKLAAEFQGRLRIVRVDGDAEPALARAHAVDAYPMLIGFQQGAEIARRQGFELHGYAALRDWVAGFVTMASGEPAPPSPAEPAFAAAVAAAVSAHDAAISPLLDAAIAAQAPHLPAHQAAVAALHQARQAGRLDDAGLQDGLADAARRLHAATGPAFAALEAASGLAEDELRHSITQATAAFVPVKWPFSPAVR